MEDEGFRKVSDESEESAGGLLELPIHQIAPITTTQNKKAKAVLVARVVSVKEVKYGI